MNLTNTTTRYGFVAIIFHWVLAFIIIFLIAAGLYMTRIPMSVWRLKLYGWHKEFGVLAFFIAILRLTWRSFMKQPIFPLHMPQWEKLAARWTHRLFYFLMLVLPVTGWLVTSAAGLPASFFGWFVLPDIIMPNETQLALWTLIHNWLAYLMLAMICLHVLAAFKHYFIDKDDILQRMF